MDIVKKYLTNGQYLTQKFEKISQFLHHTISTNAMSAWRWWNATPERVGTPYIIDRDGSIIECFDPRMWAYHLGIKGDDNYHEKHSINTELVSAGPLRFENHEFRFYPLWPNKIRWTAIPEEEVHIFSKPWKGHLYWHLYTEDQLESLKWLIGRNALDFPNLGIENDIESIFEYNEDVVKKHLPGIWAHCTVRKDKSDVFPYPPLIKALKEVQEELTDIRKDKNEASVKIAPKDPNLRGMASVEASVIKPKPKTVSKPKTKKVTKPKTTGAKKTTKPVSKSSKSLKS